MSWKGVWRQSNPTETGERRKNGEKEQTVEGGGEGEGRGACNQIVTLASSVSLSSYPASQSFVLCELNSLSRLPRFLTLFDSRIFFLPWRRVMERRKKERKNGGLTDNKVLSIVKSLRLLFPRYFFVMGANLPDIMGGRKERKEMSLPFFHRKPALSTLERATHNDDELKKK